VTRLDPVTTVLCVLVFTDTFGYAVILPLLPFAAERFGASTVLVGVLFASYSLCQLVAAPVLGSLSDRYGRRPLLLISQAGSAVGFVLLLGPSAYWILLVSRIVDGLTAGNISILYSAVLDHFPREEWVRRFAYLATATGLGILLGLIVSSVVVRLGLAGAAGVALVLTGVSLVLTWRFLPETAQRARSVSAVQAWRRATVAGDTPRLRPTILAVLLGTLAQAAFLLALPLYLERVLGYTEEAATPFIAALFVAAALFQTIGVPRVVQRLGEPSSALAAFALIALGSLILAAAGGLVGVAAGAGTVILGIALLAPTLPSMLGASSPGLGSGAVMGLNQATVSFGQMVGPLLGYGALTLGEARGYGALNIVLALFGLAVVAGLRSDP
jgi:MFS family permease